jgi:hypothetical protein
MYFLFAIYWTEKKKFQTFIITLTIILLIISNLMIFNDPFSMRRYYNQEEIDSTQNIINLNLNGTIASDLRTSALFNHLGDKSIKFGKEDSRLHNSIFYNPSYLNNLEIDYIILSESMRHIVYSRDFQTTPLNQTVFDYYKNNYKEIYNDNLMYVYK